MGAILEFITSGKLRGIQVGTHIDNVCTGNWELIYTDEVGETKIYLDANGFELIFYNKCLSAVSHTLISDIYFENVGGVLSYRTTVEELYQILDDLNIRYKVMRHYSFDDQIVIGTSTRVSFYFSLENEEHIPRLTKFKVESWSMYKSQPDFPKMID